MIKRISIVMISSLVLWVVIAVIGVGTILVAMVVALVLAAARSYKEERDGIY